MPHLVRYNNCVLFPSNWKSTNKMRVKMKLKEIAKHIGIECNSNKDIDNLATLKEANDRSVSFFHDSKYLDDLPKTELQLLF